MKKILFVGEHPLGYTGNSFMMQSILSQVDETKYSMAGFVIGEVDYSGMNVFSKPGINLMAGEGPGDHWGYKKFLHTVARTEFDILVMVGLDIWRYAPVYNQLLNIKANRKFKWVAIFPYDLQQLREDWVKWIRMVDYPCVYSRYGESMLKEAVPDIRYFRPPHYMHEQFKPLDKDARKRARKEFFNTVNDDQFVIGFVGGNQHRKNPHKMIKAFMEAKKDIPDIFLHLHTDMEGEYNLKQMLTDYGATTGSVTAKVQGGYYNPQRMAEMYNGLDCLINCSIQEGLSWTPLEAMLCGTPVIASDSTAHKELLEDGAGVLVPCTEDTWVPVYTKGGRSWVDAKCCSIRSMTNAILDMALDRDFREYCSERGLERSKAWIEGVSNINDLLDDAVKERRAFVSSPKIQKILFTQHSSAGDVLMSTQCFKGIKEKHPGKDLVYMTQKQYQDIVTVNPYVDVIIDWDEKLQSQYEIVYNPHGEKILPGGFNNLDVKLADMYPYFCKVEADEMFIQERMPDYDYLGGIDQYLEDIDQYIVVHTTGGQKEYRTYEHMDLVLKGVDIPKIQIGGGGDKACQVDLDLRGKLTWRETAWIMKRAKAAVVIDSFPAHLAGALGVPVIVLFGPAPARVTGPIGKGHICCLEANKLDVCPILSNCWGKPGTQKCMTPCINAINPQTVKKELLFILANFDNPIRREE